MTPSLPALLNHYRKACRKRVATLSKTVIVPVASRTPLGRIYEPRRLLDGLYPVLSLDDVNNEIAQRILSGEPTMVSRFGESELRATIVALGMSEWGRAQRAYWLITRLERLRWTGSRFSFLASPAGFFPTDEKESILRFKEVMKDCSVQSDILGSWVAGENLISGYQSNLEVAALGDLEPFDSLNPWTRALAGKRVLVVHPFSDSIQRQFNARDKIFPQSRLLPEFQLTALKPPTTFPARARELMKVGRTWFSELEWLKAEVARQDFEVAIIGAGAYGMPLAAHVKALGKCAIHLGGATQLLFGIWGSRWDSSPKHVALRNDFWVRPGPQERPEGWKTIEAAAYW